MKTLAVTAATLAVVGIIASAQQSKTFRTEINYVELHVSVTTKDGQRVHGLTKGDFEVRESGAAQVIQAVEEISLPMPAPKDVNRLEADGSVADGGMAANGRVYAIVIDRAGLDSSMAPKLQRQLAEFVDDFVTPSDLVAVINLGGSATTPFTPNKSRLRGALGLEQVERGRVSSDLADLAQPSAGGRFESEAAAAAAEIAEGFAKAESARTATSTVSGFDAVAELARFLRGFEGRRKAVIYVGAGADVMHATASAFDPQQKVDRNAIASAYNRMISGLVANNITVYSIDPRGLSTFDPFDGGGSQRALSLTPGTHYAGGVEMMRGLADDTGGVAAVGFNDLTKPYQRIVEDNSHYYVVGYSSDRRADGKRHQVVIAIKGRPEIEVRARRQIEAASPTAKTTPTDAAWRSTDVASLLTRPVPTADPGLRIRVTAGAVAWREGKAAVQLSAEIPPGALALRESNGAWADDVIAGFQLVDELGKVTVAKTETVRLRLRPETNNAVRERGWRYLAEFEAPPGVYQLRVAASESGEGKSGSAFLDLVVSDPRTQPLSVIGLALTSGTARMIPTAGVAPTVRLAVPSAITSARVFNASDTITVVASVVDNVPGDHEAAVTATLVMPDGTAAKRVSEAVASKDLIPTARPRAISLSLDGVAAGDYVLVVKVEAAGKSARRSLVMKVVK